jgi:hypothetical protein
MKILLLPLSFVLVLAFSACDEALEGKSKETTEDTDSLKKQKETEDMENLIVPIMKTL